MQLVIQLFQAQIQAMETSSIATANMATNEARKDIVNNMIWDQEDKLEVVIVVSELSCGRIKKRIKTRTMAPWGFVT